jgi:T4 RnlA family RNA ligase
MRYQFQPASNIQDYLEAIKGSDEFIVKRDEVNGILIINYMFACHTTFPDPMLYSGSKHRLMVLRRDCRGIKFDIDTGDVVAKPYHKFFGVNQLPETQSSVIDWSQPHLILDKLDGSLITSFKHPQNGWQWHTKMGATDVAKPVHDAVGEAYRPFCEAMREAGLTNIFEWCSRKQRIVIDYPVDQLILTGIRHNVSGQYVSYPDMVELGERFGIPVVRALEGTAENIQQFLDETADIEDAEGFVIRFETGHAVKVKGLWYSRLHNTKDILSLEKNVWSLLLHDMMDDAKAFMDDKDRANVDDFSFEFLRRLQKTALTLQTLVNPHKTLDRKTFAVSIVPTLPPYAKSMAFRLWDGHDPILVLKEFLLGHIGTQNRINEIRFLLDDLNWRDFYYAIPETD